MDLLRMILNNALFGLLIFPFFCFAGSGKDWIKMRDNIRVLRHELARQGAYAFVTNAATPRVAPLMHSQCWVDWLPKEQAERRAYEQEKRDFGLEFVKQIEKVALPNDRFEDIDAHEAHAKRMLAIAGWLKTQPGYGNYILKSWSEFIAESTIGRMAVQSRCSTNRVVALLAKIDPPEKNIDYRLTILNEEAPHRFSRPTNPQNAADTMERQWQSHYYAARRHYGKDFAHTVLGYGFAVVKDDPPEFAFYCEDFNQKYNTIRARWNAKKHYEVCVIGMFSLQLGKINEILKFRSKIDPIPMPSSLELTNYRKGIAYENKLRDLWFPFWIENNKELGMVDIGATVMAACKGMFYDYNTLELALERKGVYGPTDVP